MMTFLEHALSYATRGWRVFPVKPRDKIPITQHGFQDATTDVASIRGWWCKWPHANIGLACGTSGLTVVDLDPRNGKVELELEPTLCSKTGGGGWHHYYNGVVRSCKPLTGLDIKSEGGYVILPPSIHPSGRGYEWVNDFPIEPLPDNIRALTVREPVEHKAGPITSPTSAYLAAAIRGEQDAVTSAVEGNRNTTLYNAALKLATLGLSEKDITAALMAVTPLPKRESLATIKSGIRFGSAHLRVVPQGKLDGHIERNKPLVIGQHHAHLPSVTFTGTWQNDWTRQLKASKPEMVIVAMAGRAGIELANHLRANGVTAYLLSRME